MPISEYCLDLHSGGSSLKYLSMAEIKRSTDPTVTEKALELLKAFGAPISCISRVIDDRTCAAAALRHNLVYLATELGGAGAISRAALAVGEKGVLRALMHVGAISSQGEFESSGKIRMMEIGGPDYYVYSSEEGVFEPFVELGDEVKAGQRAAAIHFPETPWRDSVIAHFKLSGTVICQRSRGRTKRLDCLYHLATDTPL
jgi:predicted deacylase